MLTYLLGYKGGININGTDYPSVEEAIRSLRSKNASGSLVVNLLPRKQASGVSSPPANTKEKSETKTISSETIYKIKVRQYMTKPPTPEFDFHTKFNSGVKMPMRIMVGKKLEETKGMVKMELWGEMTEETEDCCMRCGRKITNAVSRYFGLGVECGGHNYVNPFDTEEELKAAVKSNNEKLKEIKWTGWIIKSAIEQEIILRG